MISLLGKNFALEGEEGEDLTIISPEAYALLSGIVVLNDKMEEVRRAVVMR